MSNSENSLRSHNHVRLESIVSLKHKIRQFPTHLLIAGMKKNELKVKFFENDMQQHTYSHYLISLIRQDLEPQLNMIVKAKIKRI
ncbi:hypothetical protein [Nostoc sp.]|uniref:hypothetical protein n=1 Tax=Nostoc sp. TaxID=1180 RepID=UPI002FF4D5F1